MTDSKNKAPEESQKTTTRRSLVMATALGSCAIAAAAACPSLALALAPLSAKGHGGQRWVKTNVKLDQLNAGEAKRVAIIDDRRDAWTIERGVQLGSVWLVRAPGDKVTAFSSVCPHLGCSVNVDANTKGFGCPCHTSSFDASGKRTGGPSPRDLDGLTTRIEADGFIAVDFRRFKIGVEEKVETL